MSRIVPLLALCVSLAACAGGGNGGRGKSDDGGLQSTVPTDALYASYSPTPGAESAATFAPRAAAGEPITLDAPSSLAGLMASLWAAALTLRLRKRRRTDGGRS